MIFQQEWEAENYFFFIRCFKFKAESSQRQYRISPEARSAFKKTLIRKILPCSLKLPMLPVKHFSPIYLFVLLLTCIFSKQIRKGSVTVQGNNYACAHQVIRSGQECIIYHCAIKVQATFFHASALQSHVHNHIMHLRKYYPHDLEKSAALWEPNQKPYIKLTDLVIEFFSLSYYCI